MSATNITARPPQFHPKNWEYILGKELEKIETRFPPNQKGLVQAEFNKVIEARYNDIEPVHQPLALKIARKFDFMTAEEKDNQYLKLPTFRLAK